MLQADAYFMASKYTEAIVAYEDFLRRNPTDSKVPFAAFRIASAYDKQSPEAKDREQYFAIKALEHEPPAVGWSLIKETLASQA